MRYLAVYRRLRNPRTHGRWWRPRKPPVSGRIARPPFAVACSKPSRSDARTASAYRFSQSLFRPTSHHRPGAGRSTGYEFMTAAGINNRSYAVVNHASGQGRGDRIHVRWGAPPCTRSLFMLCHSGRATITATLLPECGPMPCACRGQSPSSADLLRVNADVGQKVQLSWARGPWRLITCCRVSRDA